MINENFKLPNDDELRALETELRSKRHAMPPAQQPHVSNLIEQIDNYVKGDAAQRELLKPHMARAIQRMELTTARAGDASHGALAGSKVR